ncbi:MAG TPA: NAD(P) transhydrogenase subunit alpha, partial [Rhodanobacteraceae bacterium]|nr:NAD(P) transhydrogenase subunit alpha [Rhodanobacteraceae bacterium]
MPITIAALRESAAGERRVAITPETAKKYASRGMRVLLQRGAGESAGFPDAAYAGVEFADAPSVAGQADLLLCVQPPSDVATSSMKEGAALIGQLRPHSAADRLATYASRKLAAFSLELLPRTTRAQAMDVLSSQAAVAGYRAMLIAAEAAPKFFPMLTTAAGTLRPSKVLVIGAGVAGLQAIATARRLGAMVEGFDVRPETREQIESLGAKFLDLGVSAKGEGGYARELTAEERAAQQAELNEVIGGMDIVITTAQVPGRKPPVLVTADAVARMKPGSVLVDMAASPLGGNVELSKAGETIVTANGVTIIAPDNLPATMPAGSSAFYARNISTLLLGMVRDGALHL